jgi:cytochrome o ubiquinol oxidase operon protein cyoD
MGRYSREEAGLHGAALRSYLSGFVLALVLTLIPFGLVAAEGMLPRSLIVSGILVAAVAQILVHLYYFLHLNASPGERTNLVTVIFAAIILIIMAGGTVWIMVNLQGQMFPR